MRLISFNNETHLIFQMIELLPGSGVFIHQENFNVAMSKTRAERPDGKAMARLEMAS